MANYSYAMLTEVEERLPFYLVGVGCDYEQEPVNRPFGFPFFQWLQSRKGAGRVVWEGEEILLEKGSGLLLYPGTSHEYSAAADSWRVNWFTFGGFHIENLLKSIGLAKSGIYHLSSADEIELKIDLALSTLRSDKPLKGVDCSAIVYSILMDFNKYVKRGQDESQVLQYSRLSPVLEFIERNYQKVIELEDLAAVLGLTPQHLCRLFKDVLNCRPFEYVNKVRINKSKELMFHNRKLLVAELAGLCGYTDTSYFCSVFKKQEGTSPAKYREIFLIG